MTYLQFRNALVSFKIFSIGDVRKLFPGFDSKRLVEWQKKGYIHKLINKWYLFTEVPVDEMLLYRISNCLCRPSYISMESALSYHHLIPEAVYSQQAITTRKTMLYETPVGTFNYRTIKPVFFFGYQVIRKDQLPVLIADMEKALLDYLYLNASLQKTEDIEALRLNFYELKRTINWKKLEQYALVFESRTLNNRIKDLKKVLQHADAS